MLNFFKKKKLPEKPGFVFTTRNIARETGNGDRISIRGGSQSFQDSALSSYAIVSDYVGSSTNGFNTATNSLKEVSSKVDERREVNPKDVFDQIKKETPAIDFSNLDEKIIAVEERVKILSEHLKSDHLMDEHRALFYLKNRRKYLETKEKYPIDWAMTTSDAVDDLCKRYKLKIVPLKQYYTLVPKDGVKEMDRYTKAYKAITGDVPIFELVIKDADAIAPKKAEEIKKKDRDPILLANSPLGNHLFVLGAWDEEVAIVDEIIYDLK